MNIYISNWAKGQIELPELTLLLLESFIKVVEECSTDINIILLADNVTKNSLTPWMLERLDVRLVMDMFNNHKPHEWALVKLKAILLINDPSFLHIDYDIIWRYDLNEVVRIFDESDYDLIYQNKELITNKYYKQYLRRHREKAYMFDGMKERVAFNAGVTYVKDSSVLDIFRNEIQNFYSDEFGDYVSLEQMLIPNSVQRAGYNIGVLIDLGREFNYQDNHFVDGNISYDKYKQLSDMGSFIVNIGYYHFSGPSKEMDGVEDFIRLISKNEK